MDFLKLFRYFRYLKKQNIYSGISEIVIFQYVDSGPNPKNSIYENLLIQAVTSIFVDQMTLLSMFNNMFGIYDVIMTS